MSELNEMSLNSEEFEDGKDINKLEGTAKLKEIKKIFNAASSHEKNPK